MELFPTSVKLQQLKAKPEKDDTAKVASFVKRVSEGDALQALIAFKNGEIDENDLANKTFPYLKRISKEAAFRHRLNGTLNADDILSEIWIVYRRWVVERFDPSYKYLTPLVMTCVNNICLGLSRRHADVVSEEAEMVIRSKIEEEGSALKNDNVSFIDEDSVDRKLAREKIAAILAAKRHVVYDPIAGTYTHKAGFKKKSTTIGTEKMKTMLPGYISVNQKDVGPPPNAARKQPVSAKRRTKDQEELASIRKKLRLTQQRFARELVISVPRLASYEYGKTSSVPEYIMDKARSLLTSEIGATISTTERFATKSMREILDNWAKVLGIAYSDNKNLGMVCNLSVPTIVRWKNEKTRPSIQDIVMYENRVYEFANLMKRVRQESDPFLRPKKRGPKPKAKVAENTPEKKPRKTADNTKADPKPTRQKVTAPKPMRAPRITAASKKAAKSAGKKKVPTARKTKPSR